MVSASRAHARVGREIGPRRQEKRHTTETRGYEAPVNNEFLIIAQPFRSAELSLAIARVIGRPQRETQSLSQWRKQSIFRKGPWREAEAARLKPKVLPLRVCPRRQRRRHSALTGCGRREHFRYWHLAVKPASRRVFRCSGRSGPVTVRRNLQP